MRGIVFLGWLLGSHDGREQRQRRKVNHKDRNDQQLDVAKGAEEGDCFLGERQQRCRVCKVIVLFVVAISGGDDGDLAFMWLRLLQQTAGQVEFKEFARL